MDEIDRATEHIARLNAAALAAHFAARRPAPDSPAATHCADCDAEIPEARRAALPGVELCVECQGYRDRAEGRR